APSTLIRAAPSCLVRRTFRGSRSAPDGQLRPDVRTSVQGLELAPVPDLHAAGGGSPPAGPARPYPESARISPANGYPISYHRDQPALGDQSCTQRGSLVPGCRFSSTAGRRRVRRAVLAGRRPRSRNGRPPPSRAG